MQQFFWSRWLEITPIPDAVPLLRRMLERPAAAEVRSELARLYRARGYYGAARFFENTARLLEGEALLTQAVQSPVAWLANADDLSDRPRRVADEVARLALSGDFGAAIERAEKDIAEYGPSLDVVVEWADAVLMEAFEPRATVSDEAMEIALRILMTSIDEKVEKPHTFSSRAGGYANLSGVFFGLGDDASSVTAAILALSVARPGSPRTAIGAFESKRLCDRISKLRSRLSVAIDTSTLVACNE